MPSGGSSGQVLKKSSGNAYDANWANDEGLTQTEVDGRVTALVEDFAEVANASTAVPTSKGGVPSGGADNQVLTKTSGSDYAMAWETPASGGLDQAAVDARIAAFARAGNTDLVPQAKLASGGSVGQVLTRTATGQEWAASTSGRNVPLSVTPLLSMVTPSLADTGSTFTNEGHTLQLNLAAGTLNSNHPFSVSSNQLVVAAGTNPFLAIIETELEIDPTAWTTSGPGRGPASGGNRLFFDSYISKDGTELTGSRQSHYIRGDEDWAPLVHTIKSSFTTAMSPGNYTWHIERTKTAGGGNEINAIQIANSHIEINSESYAGGGGDVPIGGSAGQVLTWPQTGSTPIWATASGGLDQASVDARIAAFARAGNTDLIPRAKLASGGSVGDVLKRTASGQEWSGDIGLNQTEVDARVQAGVKDYAEQGNTTNKIPLGDLATAVSQRLLPSGGADEQILAKSAAGDYQVEWIDAPSGGASKVSLKAYADFNNTDYGDETLLSFPSTHTQFYRISQLIQLPADYATKDFLHITTQNSKETKATSIPGSPLTSSQVSGSPGTGSQLAWRSPRSEPDDRFRNFTVNGILRGNINSNQRFLWRVRGEGDANFSGWYLAATGLGQDPSNGRLRELWSPESLFDDLPGTWTIEITVANVSGNNYSLGSYNALQGTIRRVPVFSTDIRHHTISTSRISVPASGNEIITWINHYDESMLEAHDTFRLEHYPLGITSNRQLFITSNSPPSQFPTLGYFKILEAFLI